MDKPRNVFSIVIAALLGLCGLALLVGGAWLATLGGSWYYAIAGVFLLVDAWLLWQGRATALWLLAGILAATLVWAVWGSGFDWWPLAARLDVLFVLGVLASLPWTVRGVGRAKAARIALLASLAAFAAVAVASWVHDP